MGRNCGDLALYSGLTGGAEYIMLPETPFDPAELSAKLSDSQSRGKDHFLIIKAEGVDIKNETLADYIKTETGQEPRQVVLGYLQRGDNPSAQDRLLATRMGKAVVDLIERDEESLAVGIVGNEIKSFTFEEALATTREADLDLMALMEQLQ